MDEGVLAGQSFPDHPNELVTRSSSSSRHFDTTRVLVSSSSSSPPPTFQTPRHPYYLSHGSDGSGTTYFLSVKTSEPVLALLAIS